MVLSLFPVPVIVHHYHVTKVCSLYYKRSDFFLAIMKWSMLTSSSWKLHPEIADILAVQLYSCAVRLSCQASHVLFSSSATFSCVLQVLKEHGQDFLVGNKFSWADVQLIEAILAVEEKIPAVLSGFPQLQVILYLPMRVLRNENWLPWSDHLSMLCKTGVWALQGTATIHMLVWHQGQEGIDWVVVCSWLNLFRYSCPSFRGMCLLNRNKLMSSQGNPWSKLPCFHVPAFCQ